MSGQQPHRDLEIALGEWMDDVAPGRAPVRLLEGTFARTMKATQVRTYPWRRVGPGLSGRGVASWRTGLAGASLVALVVALGAGGLVGSLWTAPPTPAPSPSPSPTATAEPPTPTLPAPVSITATKTSAFPEVVGFVRDESAIWGINPGRIDRIDPITFKVTGTVALGPETGLYNEIALNDDGLWAADWNTSILYRVDPATLTVVATIPAGMAPKGILANAEGVWVADTHDGKVLRIDTVTNTVATSITVGPPGNSGPNWLASGLGSIWVDIPNDASIVRIDPVTDLIQATIPTPPGFTACGGFAIGTDAVWVSGCDASAAVGRVDPSTNTSVATIPIPGHGGPSLIVDEPWVSVDTGDATSGLIVRIDPATNTIDRVLVPDVPFGGGGALWVDSGSVWVHDYYNHVIMQFPLSAFE
jgi:streptogramin lyase